MNVFTKEVTAVFKRLWAIFARDMKVGTRDFITLLVLLFPLVFAFGINLITPGINDTTVNVAMVAGEDPERAAYFDRFAHLTLLADRQAVADRVMQRDSLLGVVRDGSGLLVLAQGNEPEESVELVKLIAVLYDAGAPTGSDQTELESFGRTIPPLKQIMVNALLLFISVLAGMLIALNIIEEKTDKTISAIHVTPVSRLVFILGKSLTGAVFAILMSLIGLMVTGFGQVNLLQMLPVILAITLLSIMIGFIQGINGDDVMEAAGSVKLMFLPLAGSIVGYELLAEKWHPFLYWSPFYWAYRANDMILSQDGNWAQLLLFVGVIALLCAIVFAILAPRIQKGLQAQ